MNDILSLASHDPAIFQCSLFAACFISLWFLERRSHGEALGAKAKHSAVNTAFMLSALPIQLALIAVCLRLATYVTEHHIGLVYLLPGAHNPWIRFGLMFLVLDLLDYVYHYLAHNVPFLWRFHLVHHSDRDVDVSTTFREHPGETLIRVSFLILWVGLTGASVGVLALRQTFETFANLSQHTRFRLPPWAQAIVGRLFVTSNLHHAHHHFQLPGTNCNYGDVFSLWDRLFGTYRDLGATPIVFGLDTHLDATDFEIFCEPLRSRAAGVASRLSA